MKSPVYGALDTVLISYIMTSTMTSIVLGDKNRFCQSSKLFHAIHCPLPCQKEILKQRFVLLVGWQQEATPEYGQQEATPKWKANQDIC